MFMSFSDMWNKFSSWIYENLTYTLKLMYSLITKFPKISEMGELYDIWQFITLVSICCLGIIITYLGLKIFVNSASSTNQIKVKSIFGRLIYAACFIAISRPAIDLLIDFNNTLVEVFVKKFNLIGALSEEVYVNQWVSLIAIALAIFQLYLAGNIMIGYFLRVAEVALMYVTTPVMCTLWVNPNWSGHLNSWISRLVSLIFTQFAQIVILIIYSKLIFNFYGSVSVFNLCLGAAFLILMKNMPSWIEKYIAPDNSGKIMVNTYKTINKNTKAAKLAISKLGKKDDSGEE